jgi:hypothetical protein
MAEQIDATVARRVAVEATPVGTDPVVGQLITYLRPKAVSNPEEAMRIMAGRDVPPREVAHSFIDRQVGPNELKTVNAVVNGVNVARKDRTARPAFETQMLNDATTRVDQVYDFLERGVITPQIQREVLRVLYNDPGYRRILAEQVGGLNILTANYPGYMANPGTIPANIRSIVDEIIQGPEYKLKLEDLVKKHIDITKPIEDKGSENRQKTEVLQREVDEIKKQQDAKQANTVAKELEEIDALISLYKLDNAGNPRARLQAIQDANKLLGQYKGDKAVLDAELAGESAALSVPATRGPAQLRIAAIRPLMSNLDKQITEQQNIVTALENELKELQTRRTTLRTKLDELKDKEGTKQAELAGEKTKLGPMEGEKLLKEQSFVDNITGMFADATIDSLNARLTQINNSYDQLLTKRRQTEKDELKREFTEQVRERYFGALRQVFHPSLIRGLRGGNIFVEGERPIEGRTIEEDMNVYRTEGVEGLMREVIGGQIEDQIRTKYGRPRPNPLSPEMTKEMEEKLREFVTESGNEVVLNLLVTRHRNGITLNLPDVRLVQANNPGIMQTVIDRNKALRDDIEKIAGSGALNNFSRWPEGILMKVWTAVLNILGFGGQTVSRKLPY